MTSGFDAMKLHSIPVLAACGMLVLCRSDATDVVYTNNLALYVIHDVEQGNGQGQHLDRPVGIYTTDAGAVLYLKSVELWLIRDTRKPQPELLDRPVGSVKIDGGVIAYIKGNSLYVRRLSEEAATQSRMVANSLGCSSFYVKDGKVVFIKAGRTAYLVSDIDTGTSEHLASLASEAMISK